MAVLFFLVLSLGFLIYGGLVISRTFTPLGAKILVEEEDQEKWCRTEGYTKILWGLDLAFFAMYLQGAFLPVLWLGCFLVMTIYIIYLSYRNNQRYMK